MFAEDPDLANEFSKKILIAAVVGALTSVFSFLVGRWWGRYKAGRAWHRKEFLGRVIVSLNIFTDGFLKIRTVIERSLEEVFLNQVAVDKVMAAAKLTTTDSPILPIPKNDRWFLLNFVLNAVAEQFATGHVKRDAGEKVITVRYALFLTCEQFGDERIRKVRAMLLKKEHLDDFPYMESMPQLENPWHEDRMKTLRRAVELYKKEPDHFLMLEVCV